MSGGRLFQRRLSATGKAQSLTVDSHVRRITSCDGDDNQRQRQLESELIQYAFLVAVLHIRLQCTAF